MSTRHQALVTYCAEHRCSTLATSICARCGGGLCASHDLGENARCGRCELFFEESHSLVKPRFVSLEDDAGLVAAGIALLASLVSPYVAYLLYETPWLMMAAMFGPFIPTIAYLKYDKAIKDRRFAKRHRKARLRFLEKRHQLPPEPEPNTNE